MIRTYLLMFFIMMNTLFAGVTVLERGPGRIELKISVDTLALVESDNTNSLSSDYCGFFVNKSGYELPALKLSMFVRNPEYAKVTLSVEKRNKLHLTKPLKKTESRDIVLQQSSVSDPYTSLQRRARLSDWYISPVLSVTGNAVEQFTEARVIITYPPVNNPQQPVGDYYKAVAYGALNPDEFFLSSRAKASRSARSETDGHIYLDPNEKALQFTVAGKAGTLKEADGSIDGLVKLVPDSLTYLGTTLDINRIAVYATNPWIHSRFAPDSDKLPSSLIEVPLIIRDKNSDGIFNSNDEILFFAGGTNFWYYEFKDWKFNFNDFTEKRKFFITAGSKNGEKIEKTVLPTASSTTYTSGMQLTRYKKSHSITTTTGIHGHSDKEWIWEALRANNTETEKLTLNNIFREDTTHDSKLRFIKGTSSYNPLVKLWPGNKTISGKGTWLTIPHNSESFKLQMSGFDHDDFHDFRGYDLKWYTHLDMENRNSLRFYSPQVSVTSIVQIANYKVQNLPAEFTVILRMNAEKQTVELIDTITGLNEFTWPDTSGKGYEYYIGTAADAKTVQLSPKIDSTVIINADYQVRNLHDPLNRSDYMIITPTDFLSQSLTLAQHKVDVNMFQNPTVVTTEDLYREFSGGVPEPSAIRNFMVYVHDKWQYQDNISESPDYMVLMGTGHYDYKGIIHNDKNYIYPYIHSQDVKEDFYSSLQGDGKPSLAMGRIPGKTTTEIQNYLDKLIYMESYTSNFSQWRNRILLLSDDDMQGNKQETIMHYKSSDSVGDIILEYAPAKDIQKVNLFEYERDGVNKSGAKSDFIDQINNGIAHINYFGHGNYSTITDEAIFNIDEIKSLNNKDRYPIFSAFSCAVSFFDMPNQKSLAGELIVARDKGAIISIASTRNSYVSGNVPLAKEFAKALYSDSGHSTGMAFKIANGKSPYDLYSLFGDPSYQPLNDNIRIDLTLFDKEENPIDTMMAVQDINIRASIPVEHNIDTISFEFQNPEQTDVKRKDGLNGSTIAYTLPGIITKRYLFPVENGVVNANIRSPLIEDISTISLRAYGWSKDCPKTVTGMAKDIVFHDVDYDNIDKTDKTGPSIVASLAQNTTQTDTLPGAVGNRIVIDGFEKKDDGSSHPASLDIYFTDKSGIDFWSKNPGEGITVSIKEVRKSQSYNRVFKQLMNNENSGKISLFLRKDEFPGPGEYEMTVSASDGMKNSSSERFILELKSLDDEQYNIGDFYAFPSPVHLGESTRFFFNNPNGGVHRMTLKIFTLSGQLVRQFNDVRPGVRWDLSDQHGNRLSPNVYLYRLYIERDSRAENAGISSGDEYEKEIIKSAVRKMVIYPPR